jgi:hypothetical protein
VRVIAHHGSTVSLTLCAMLLAFFSSVDAQQAGKMFRIGFLDSSTPSGIAVLVEAFVRSFARLAGLRERTLGLSSRLPSRSLTVFLSLPQN